MFLIQKKFEILKLYTSTSKNNYFYQKILKPKDDMIIIVTYSGKCPDI